MTYDDSDIDAERLAACVILGVKDGMQDPSHVKLPYHMQRDAIHGRRPFLTCTIAPDTLPRLDALASLLGLSRGRLIDRLVSEATSEETED